MATGTGQGSQKSQLISTPIPLRSSWAIQYSFSTQELGQNPVIWAGGRSKDFTAGRGGVPTDFFGHGDKSSRSRCAELRDFAPICKEVKPDVVWMIRFPNAEYLCEQVAQDAPPEHFIFTPRVRIEVNLAWNRTITGFVFEAPFLSEELSQKLNSELLPILGLDPLGPDGKTRECDTARRQAFDDRVKDFIEMTKSDALDDNTKEIIAELMHLATSITFLSKGGG